MVETRSRAIFFLIVTCLTIALWIKSSTQTYSQVETENLTYLPVISKRSAWYQSPWNIECVDCSHYFPDLAPDSTDIDSSGQPHVIYGGKDLYYAYILEDGEWIEDVARSDYLLFPPTMAIDAADHPHTVYLSSSSAYYGNFDGSRWHFEELPSSMEIYGYPGGPNNFVSIDIDSLSRPHISFISERNGYKRLGYAHRGSDGWESQKLISLSNPTEYSKMVLDSEDQPHIVTSDQGTIFYIRFNGTIWLLEIVAHNSSGSPSLDLDASGQPHIAYHDSMQNSLNYMHKGDAGWHLEVIDNVIDDSLQIATGLCPSIKIDNSGLPHIAYLSESEDNPYELIRELKYAYRDSDGWHKEIARELSDPGYISMAIEESSTPQIVFKDAGNLYHLQKTNNNWNETKIDSSRRKLRHSIFLALDVRDATYISYIDEEQGTFELASWVGSEWSASIVSESVEAEFNCGHRYTSLSIAPDSTKHMLFPSDSTIYHTAISGFDEYDHQFDLWCSANSHIHGGIYMALDSQSRPYVMLDRLWVGEFDELANEYIWTSEPIEVLDWFEAIAVDSNDNPIVAGRYNELDGIRYAIKTNEGWRPETVSTDERFTSMALDPSGRPHFALLARNYLFGYSTDISYIYFDGLNWVQEILDLEWEDETFSDCEPGIAIDSNFGVHLAYESVSGSVNYVYRDNGGWHSPIRLEMGDSCSLALNSLGIPYIAYLRDGDLKIAYPTNN